MNIDAKSSTKYWHTEFNDLIKRLYTMAKGDLFLECKNGSMYENQSI